MKFTTITFRLNGEEAVTASGLHSLRLGHLTEADVRGDDTITTFMFPRYAGDLAELWEAGKNTRYHASAGDLLELTLTHLDGEPVAPGIIENLTNTPGHEPIVFSQVL